MMRSTADIASPTNHLPPSITGFFKWVTPLAFSGRDRFVGDATNAAHGVVDGVRLRECMGCDVLGLALAVTLRKTLANALGQGSCFVTDETVSSICTPCADE